MKAIIKELFGFTCANRQVYDFKPGVKTTNVKHSLTFEQWCHKFNVSIAHGKTAVHFG